MGRASREGFLDRVWPEYNHHGNNSPATFRALGPRYGDFQVLFIDQRTDRIIARGRTITFRWDGTLADLPDGSLTTRCWLDDGEHPGHLREAGRGRHK